MDEGRTVMDTNLFEYTPPRRDTMRDKFEAFDAENPHVFAALVHYAESARRAGRSKIGMKMLWERLRWYAAVEIDTDEDFKLNNNFTAFYARKLVRVRPEFAGMVEMRASAADGTT